MSRPKAIDSGRPVASLLEVAGLTQVQLAGLAGKAQSTIAGAVARGEGIGLDVLARLVDAAGFKLTLRIERKHTA